MIVTRTHSRILATLWLLAWLPLASPLLPLPPERARQAITEADQLAVQLRALERPAPGSEAAKAIAQHEARVERWKRNPWELERSFWMNWAFGLAQLTLGVVGSILLFVQKRTWIAFGIFSAALYLAGHHFGIFFWGVSSVAEALARLRLFAASASSFAAVLHFELVLPLLSIWILAMAVIAFKESGRKP